MTALPPGYEIEEAPPRKVQFTFAPGTPPEVIAATKAWADADAQQESEIPAGYEIMGPGPGQRVTDPRVDEQQRADLIRAGADSRPDPFAQTGPSQIGRGLLYGLPNTALGVMQFEQHVNPVARGLDALGGVVGVPSQTDLLDSAIADRRSEWEQDPASQTTAGKYGEFLGGMVGTGPLAVASVPGKSASLLSVLGRGAGIGAATAATQPVNGDDFAADKTKQAGLGALVGAGIPGGTRAVMWTGERLWGPNFMAQVGNVANKRANAKPFAQESEDLSQRTGVRFTPGQVSGSRVMTSLENMSRQSVFSADKAFEADSRIADDAVRYMDKLMDNITRNPAGEAAIGTQMQNVSRGAVEKIAARRDEVANRMYGEIDAALGNRPFVKPTNALREADAIIAQYGKIPTPEAARIVKQAQEMKAKLSQGHTFREAQATRSYYGRGARGAANVFDDLNPDINRQIATRLFKAWDADMEQSAAGLSGKGPGMVPHGTVDLAEAIKRANAGYRRYSQLIEATKAHPIARLFGDNIHIEDVVQFDKIPPETVISRLGQMKPTELKLVRDFMEGQAPEAWQQYKRLLVEKAVAESHTLPASMGANTVPFNASRFVRALGGDKKDKIEQLNAIFSASEMKEIDDAFAVARRLGDRFGYNGAGTGPYNEVANFAHSFMESLKNLSAKATASTGGEVLGLRSVANVMANADGRRALIQLSKLPPQSRQAASIVAYLTALSAGQQATDPRNQHRGAHP